jgi:hypothetical protein
MGMLATKTSPRDSGRPILISCSPLNRFGGHERKGARASDGAVSEVLAATSGRFGFRTDFPMCAILNRHAAENALNVCLEAPRWKPWRTVGDLETQNENPD